MSVADAVRPCSTVVVDCSAISHNTEVVARFVRPAKVFAVVKARAYGHGATEVAQAAVEAGAHGLCVATTREAVDLIGHLPSRTPILVLGSSSRADREPVAAAGLQFVAHSTRDLAEMSEAGTPCHIELNSGMNRWGLPQLPELLPTNTVGVMTHLAHGHLDPSQSARELDGFLAMTSHCDSIMRHAASSGPVLTERRSHLDAVRCGQLLLGLQPSVTPTARLDLRPALSWTSHVTHVQKVRKGDRVGYGGRFRAPGDMWLGVVPVGYADGFPSAMSGSSVVVDEVSVAVVGAVSMDCFTVALPQPVPVGSKVTLIGPRIPIEEHARAAGVGNVELAVGITQARGRGVMRHVRQDRSEVGAVR